MRRSKSTGLLWCLIFLLTGVPRTEADGCFVMRPFVWEKHKDINEPSQKAIIVHDAGREDMILQVKYDGLVAEFGWLIPVPGLPTVQRASMECFYELSRYSQEHFESRGGSLSLTRGSSRGAASDAVSVIEVKTVGAYEIAVLSSKDAGSLSAWLAENQFSFSKENPEVIESYIKQGWYFVAIKINLKQGDAFQVGTRAPRRGTSSVPESVVKWQLSQGELHPLQISFDSEKCIFPLKISSINGTASEVQIYTLSSQPLVEASMFERQLADLRRPNSQPFKDNFGNAEATAPPTNSLPSIIAAAKKRGMTWPGILLLQGKVSSREISSCSRQLTRLHGKSWWLSKQTWKF